MRKPRAKNAFQAASGIDANKASTETATVERAPADKEVDEQPQEALITAGESEASQTSAPAESAAIAIVETADIESAVGTVWPDPDTSFLTPAVAPAPTLPMEKLPAKFSELVAGLVEARKLVPDYVAFAVLGAVSGAIGNRARVGLPDGTTETLSTYIVLVGDASKGKGNALKVVEEPLRVIDNEMCGDTRGAAATDGQEALNTILEQIQSKVSRRLAIDYENAVASVTEPVSASLLVTEGTASGLLDELSMDQNGRMLLTHEITGSLGYLMSSQAARSQGILLSAFDGGPYTARSKSGGRLRVPALVLSILGATQPRKLPALLRGADDGFAARVFWVYPNVESTAEFGSDPGPVDVLHNLLSRLISIKPAGDGTTYSTIIPLAAGARELVETASAIWLRQQDLSGELFATALGRGRQYAIRIGGLFEILDHVVAGKHGLPVAVGHQAMASAIALVDGYILPMAERTFTSHRPKDSDASALAKYLARAGKPEINGREDIVRGHGSPLREPLAVREALEELRQRGLVRPAPRGAGRGRPSGDWQVHPALLALGRA
ncbi:DUF3987 domain-containing protein [Devosia sp. ZB163]|uniref:DUF3987 domain-containing protein n=1 Tax=Devosia sp. ZB163 TaxID=3025938 RepID=UPI00236092B6|nr:DUF3987 domain-containing protein [Devosia sp. ZB163]MDC9823288.1 DUF3987 domain-containing protein [Devosia sp. ZB163]